MAQAKDFNELLIKCKLTNRAVLFCQSAVISHQLPRRDVGAFLLKFKMTLFLADHQKELEPDACCIEGVGKLAAVEAGEILSELELLCRIEALSVCPDHCRPIGCWMGGRGGGIGTRRNGYRPRIPVMTVR